MNSVTLEGPIVLLPADEYQNLLLRLVKLEKTVSQLTQLVEDIDDVRVMREAEADYLAGDTVDFADLIAEVQVENN
jgi:t-SNARE complex subunit (syntaxin)